MGQSVIYDLIDYDKAIDAINTKGPLCLNIHAEKEFDEDLNFKSNLFIENNIVDKHPMNNSHALYGTEFFDAFDHYLIHCNEIRNTMWKDILLSSIPGNYKYNSAFNGIVSCGFNLLPHLICKKYDNFIQSFNTKIFNELLDDFWWSILWQSNGDEFKGVSPNHDQEYSREDNSRLKNKEDFLSYLDLIGVIYRESSKLNHGLFIRQC